MTSVLGRRHVTDPGGKTVKYTPCAKGEHTDEEELDEIHVVNQENTDSRAESAAATAATAENDPEQGQNPAANGPRVLPGQNVFTESSDRVKLIGERLSETGRIPRASPVGSSHVLEQKTTSKQSLFEMVSHKIDSVKQRSRSRTYSTCQEMGYINKAHVSDPVTPKSIRKQRKKELEERFGKKSRGERFETSTNSSSKDGCKWTFVFDPAGRFAYWWSFVVSIAFIYNFWVLIYRFAFEEINEFNMATWFTLDYIADFIYILDIAFHFRTGYLEDGVLQTDGTKLRLHYMNSTMFYIDCLCLLPLDFLYLSIGFKSMLRCFRLVKIYRFWAFLDRTERHTNYPNMVRTVTLLHYLLAIYHWNACLIYVVTTALADSSVNRWNYPPKESGVFTIYLHSMYWSTLTLTTIGNLPQPESNGEYIFVIMEFVFGLLLFSTILGHVANIVTGISAARRDFQMKLDSVKTYMILRRVPLRIQDRVIKWFDYLWLSKKSSDEDKTLGLLPDKLKAEIALHVHLDTLKRVEIFQNTDAGFLCELVLRLRPVLFSPKDYICRKGEVGKEMYVVNRGKLQVVADNGKTVLATLRAGSYFGEISILNMGNAGNRRTASVRSVGYSDLFVLSKKDLWEVLKDYPTARVRLEAIAVKRLEKYKKAPLEQVALPRSKSTPGLLESGGKIPLEAMMINRYNTLPAGGCTPHGSSIGSRCTMHSNPEDLDAYSLAERISGSHHSGSGGSTGAHAAEGEDPAVRAAASADITNSMTVSSITSYVTESSNAQKSPTAIEMIRAAASPPSSPRVTTSTEGSIAVRITPSPLRTSPSSTSAFVPIKPNVLRSQGQQQYLQGAMGPPVTYPEGYTPSLLTTHRSNASPVPRLSPFNSYMPQSGYSHSGVPTTQAGNNYYQTLPAAIASTPVLYPVPPTTQYVSGSAGSLQPNAADPSSEVLLQEITRLRDRVHTLESENTSMNQKLHQQNVDVEHRLTEIEMHFCGEDSITSGESETLKNLQGNNESVI